MATQRPVHKLRPANGAVARTWCATDPYRKGIQIEDATRKATCKYCLHYQAVERESGK